MRLLIIFFGLLLFGCNSVENTSAIEAPSHTNLVVETAKEIELQNGDLIFHTSRSSQSQAIQIATNSKYSHMGVVYREGDNYYVYEAVQPVRMTKLKDWIARGEDGKYVVKRLKNSQAYLSIAGVQKMKTIGQKYLGKDYDLRFEWSDDKIYCSELVWKIYKKAFNIEIGQLEKFGDFDLSNDSVQDEVQERYGSNIPKDEYVITPDRMFNSERLMTVKEE